MGQQRRKAEGKDINLPDESKPKRKNPLPGDKIGPAIDTGSHVLSPDQNLLDLPPSIKPEALINFTGVDPYNAGVLGGGGNAGAIREFLQTFMKERGLTSGSKGSLDIAREMLNLPELKGSRVLGKPSLAPRTPGQYAALAAGKDARSAKLIDEAQKMGFRDPEPSDNVGGILQKLTNYMLGDKTGMNRVPSPFSQEPFPPAPTSPLSPSQLPRGTTEYSPGELKKMLNTILGDVRGSLNKASNTPNAPYQLPEIGPGFTQPDRAKFFDTITSNLSATLPNLDPTNKPVDTLQSLIQALANAFTGKFPNR